MFICKFIDKEIYLPIYLFTKLQIYLLENLQKYHKKDHIKIIANIPYQ